MVVAVERVTRIVTICHSLANLIDLEAASKGFGTAISYLMYPTLQTGALHLAAALFGFTA